MTRILAVLSLLSLQACGYRPPTTPVRLADGAPHAIPGIAACSPDQPPALELDPGKPLVVLVHGCASSGGKFRALAEVFALHDQHAVCFNYDDRDSLAESSAQLRAALAQLRGRHRHRDMTVLGHSQGGLVARMALSGGGGVGRLDDRADYELVTVSSPFGGVASAADCGSVVLHVITLGITVAVCQIVAGSKWSEIHEAADEVRRPAPLSPRVERHLAIVTDERDTCRRQAPDGRCEEDDYVFSLAEQDNPRIQADPRVLRDRVAAGHVEIVGGSGMRPHKLIEALQRHGVLAPTPPDRRRALSSLLRRLFSGG